MYICNALVYISGGGEELRFLKITEPVTVFTRHYPGKDKRNRRKKKAYKLPYISSGN